MVRNIKAPLRKKTPVYILTIVNVENSKFAGFVVKIRLHVVLAEHMAMAYTVGTGPVSGSRQPRIGHL